MCLLFVQFTIHVVWSSCALIKMIILIYAQLDHSIYTCVYMRQSGCKPGGIRRGGYFAWI